MICIGSTLAFMHRKDTNSQNFLSNNVFYRSISVAICAVLHDPLRCICADTVDIDTHQPIHATFQDRNMSY